VKRMEAELATRKAAETPPAAAPAP
jgi:hypothetical protein